MDALVQAQSQGPDGLQLAVTTVRWSIEIGAKDSPIRFAGLLAPFINRRELADELRSLEQMYVYAGEPETWINVVEQLGQQTRKRKTKRVAALVAARIKMDVGRLEEARRMLDDITRNAPHSDAATRAKALLYELEHLQVGMPAPGFEATTIDGTTVSLKSFQGKPVLLNFWATWCVSCLGEVPTVKSAKSRFKEDLVILGISVDERRDAVIKTIKARDVPGIQTWDQLNGKNPVAEIYRVEGLPTWYLLDGEGRIAARNPLGDKLIPAVARLLQTGGREPAPSTSGGR
jgi:thiol-disulfide isomerase/thioredoxin